MTEEIEKPDAIDCIDKVNARLTQAGAILEALRSCKERDDGSLELCCEPLKEALWAASELIEQADGAANTLWEKYLADTEHLRREKVRGMVAVAHAANDRPQGGGKRR